MQPLNLPRFPFRTRTSAGKPQIFDDTRKKFVALTPEEWVRQHFVKFLQIGYKFPPSLMAIEMPVEINGLKQRADIVVYNRNGQPMVIVECKAPNVPVTNHIFDQAARYNLKLKVDYLMITNGLVHYCAKLDHQNGTYRLLNVLPMFESL
ncbi:MAG: type I restriction enzyme HsdR N-terminal domain-containing protein [Breznakibacter sp.]